MGEVVEQSGGDASPARESVKRAVPFQAYVMTLLATVEAGKLTPVLVESPRPDVFWFAVGADLRFRVRYRAGQFYQIEQIQLPNGAHRNVSGWLQFYRPEVDWFAPVAQGDRNWKQEQD